MFLNNTNLSSSRLLKCPYRSWIIRYELHLTAKKDMILVIYNRLSKMTYFVVTIERTLAEGLARLFRNNMWKLHGLLESMILDRKLQFIVELTRKLNQMLEIKTKLLTFFHLQIDRQTKQIN